MQQQFEPEETATTEPPRHVPAAKEATIGTEQTGNAPNMAEGTIRQYEVPAERPIQYMTHAMDFEQLLAVVRLETKQRKRNMWILLGAYAGVFCLLLLVATIVGIRTGHFPGAILGSLGSFGAIGAVAAGATTKQKDATKLIAQFDDVRAVGPLIDALTFNDPNLVQVVVPALTRLLPRLQATDAALLNAEQRATLNRRLLGRTGIGAHGPGGTPQALFEAILQAWQQVGDEKALPVVERLSQGDGMALRYSELKARAAETLPFLRQRIEQERASQSLLRAYAVGVAATDTLLRAATPTAPAEEPQQLLRADPQERR